MKRRAALFDMDRTLLRKETASLYVRYQRDMGEASYRDLLRALYWVGLYTLGLLDAEKVAAEALKSLAGQHEVELAFRCDDWFSQYVERYITDEGRLAVAKHRAAGDVIAIVTGASPYAAWPLARRLRIDHVVSSRFEVDAEGRFTGRPEAPLCLGHGKVERARAFATSVAVDLADATFYSDSVSDLPLLDVVREPVAVNPDPRLRRIARRRGFRIETW